MQIDDFRRQVNAGLERQGYIPVWRPKGAAPGSSSRYDCQLCNPEDDPRAFGGHRPALQNAEPRVGRDDWQPTQPFVERTVRRAVYRLRYYLRPYQRPRIRACGFAMVSPGGVGVQIHPDGRASYQGLATCGSVWECPSCQARIKAKRAEEIRTVVEAHGSERVMMLTLTFRHGLGDDLKHARAGLADAWRGFTRGKPWQAFRRRMGVVGTIRAMELTHGPNGWHPHLHVLLLLNDDPEERAAIAGDELLDQHRAWMAGRWAEMVVRYLGPEHEPDDLHGLTLQPIQAVEYLSKLGLELSDPGRKHGRKAEHRTPLEIAADLAEVLGALRSGRDERWLRVRRARDRDLWKVYAEGMRGARHLTWSRGLKKAHGIRDRTDLEVAQDEEPMDGEKVVIGQLDGAEWRTIRSRRVGHVSACYWILTEAERGGAPGLRKAVDAVVSGRVGLVGA